MTHSSRNRIGVAAISVMLLVSCTAQPSGESPGGSTSAVASVATEEVTLVDFSFAVSAAIVWFLLR